MSTNAKTGKKPLKKARCKMATPISNDRAEAFVGPQADIRPLFSEAPSDRDARAFDLQAKGMTQRQIAQKLGWSQSTVHRAIKKYRLWFGTTLPEDRGEMTGWARFRVAVEEQRIFLRHQQELAMEEWERSRRPVPMRRTRTKLDPEGRKKDGAPIKEIQIDEYVQRRHASVAHLNAAARRSLELTMLEAGYLGARRLSCDQAIDTDERERWDRAVKSHEATIEELTRKVAELEAKMAAKDSSRVHGAERNARVSDESSVVNQPQGNTNPACISQSLMHPAPAAKDSPLEESRTAARSPVLNQASPVPEVASPIQKPPSGDQPESPRPVSQRVNPENQVGVPALAGLADLSNPPEGGTPARPGASRQPPRQSYPAPLAD
jgi:hypothetical protein